MLSFMKDIDHYKLFWAHGEVKIDTWISWLHHRVTVLILLFFFGVVCNQQYFGKPIECIQDINSDSSAVPLKVMNTYCFVTSTFTIIKPTGNFEPLGNLGSFYGTPQKEELRHHDYYQWVPLLLLFQAILLKIPYLFWEHLEGGLLQNLIINLKFESKDDPIQPKLKIVAKYLVRRINTHGVWLSGFVLHEVFSLLMLALNILLTHCLFSGYFLPYGFEILQYSFSFYFERIGTKLMGYGLKHPSEILFPKLTKCRFYKYGPSGGIQNHDFMCIMTLNVVNEKIFAFLWFWYLILLVISCLNLLWRFFSFLAVNCLSGSKSAIRNKIVSTILQLSSNKQPHCCKSISNKFHYSDWMLLSFLSYNLRTTPSFSKLVKEINRLCEDCKESPTV